jgi:hypothetical protein
MDAFLRSGRTGRVIELPGELRLVRECQGFRLGPARAGDDGSPPRMLSSSTTVGFPPRGSH